MSEAKKKIVNRKLKKKYFVEKFSAIWEIANNNKTVKLLLEQIFIIIWQERHFWFIDRWL